MAPSTVIMITMFAALSVLVLPMMANSQRIQLDRPYQGGDQDQDLVFTPQKRPFCNAFSGCGKKRSLPNQAIFTPNLPKYKLPMSDGENSENYPDLSMEQNVDEMARQILAEAKLLEAIQRAIREVSRQRLSAGLQ